MFHNIPASIQERMSYLEAVDACDRKDGTPRMERLRQVPPQTGKFLALLAASAPVGQVLEIGTSAGYSSLWLALACRQRGDKLVTFELLAEKVRLARETFAAASVAEIVQLVHGDAREHLSGISQIAFCFMDAEKEIYTQCFALVVPNLVVGGFFVADNVISHQEELQTMVDQALSDDRVDVLVIPIGKGLLVCRKV